MPLRWATADSMVAGLAAILTLAAALVTAADGEVDSQAIEATLTPHVGKVIDLVELGTGARLVRPRLEGLTHSRGEIAGIRVLPESARVPKTIRLAGIARIMANREVIYQAATNEGRNPTQAQRDRARYDRELQASTERMAANGVTPWPVLSGDDHATEAADLERFVQQVKQAFPLLQMTSTHEFLVATDIPAAQVGPFIAKLDTMHDFLCNLYGIPRGEPVWKGTCVVIAFLREEDFFAFEERFMGTRVRGVHGLCHQRSDGRVVMACHRGDDAPAFAHMLVHETSHGFNHRWLSPVRIPSWLNEGIAEWVGTQVVPVSNQVPLKELAALATMRSTGRVGEGFFDEGDSKIEPLQYGVASSLVRFLVDRDRRKFAAFVRAVKEGTPVEEALRSSYRAGLDELLLAYGRTVGVPSLAR